jgi:hypothetical protein
MAPHAIIAPLGGFSNHLRWLLMLDSKYSFKFDIDVTGEEILYTDLRGASWPNFKEWNELDPNKLDQKILIEISDRFDIEKLKTIASTTRNNNKTMSLIEDKISFIADNVYGKDRSWQNWIYYEFQYRIQLIESIALEHPGTFDSDIHRQFDKIIAVTTDPTLAMHSYIKFNSNMGLTPIDDFIMASEINNQEMIKYAGQHENILLVNSDSLWQPSLDKNLYNTIIKWFDLTDNYKYANKIHNIWFNLHKKAEKEIVTYFHNLYI